MKEHAYSLLRLALILVWSAALAGIGAWVFTTLRLQETYTAKHITRESSNQQLFKKETKKFDNENDILKNKIDQFEEKQNMIQHDRETKLNEQSKSTDTFENQARFIDYGDGTVTDVKKNLMWQKEGPYWDMMRKGNGVGS